MAKTMLAISLLVGAGACSPAPTSQPGRTSMTEPPTTSEPTTTELPVTTTSEAPETVEVATSAPPTTRARSAPTTRPYVPVPVPVVADEDFWYRLATCESGNGRLSANQFQFQGGTAEKVGYYAGASYAEQRAMAQDWAARIHPNEGTSAGWPVCWWRAQ